MASVDVRSKSPSDFYLREKRIDRQPGNWWEMIKLPNETQPVMVVLGEGDATLPGDLAQARIKARALWKFPYGGFLGLRHVPDVNRTNRYGRTIEYCEILDLKTVAHAFRDTSSVADTLTSRGEDMVRRWNEGTGEEFAAGRSHVATEFVLGDHMWEYAGAENKQEALDVTELVMRLDNFVYTLQNRDSLDKTEMTMDDVMVSLKYRSSFQYRLSKQQSYNASMHSMNEATVTPLAYDRYGLRMKLSSFVDLITSAGFVDIVDRASGLYEEKKADDEHTRNTVVNASVYPYEAYREPRTNSSDGMGNPMPEHRRGDAKTAFARRVKTMEFVDEETMDVSVGKSGNFKRPGNPVGGRLGQSKSSSEEDVWDDQRAKHANKHHQRAIKSVADRLAKEAARE